VRRVMRSGSRLIEGLNPSPGPKFCSPRPPY